MNEPAKDPRVYLAVEHTLLAWIRTGLAMMGFGFVVAPFGLFLRELGTVAPNIPVKSTGFSLWTGTALVLAGVVVNAVSTVQYLHTIRDLNEGRDVAGRLRSRCCASGCSLHRWNGDGGLFTRDSIVGLD
jgi:putative membrane protein